jgi:DNA-binding PadR family transcriptional regulator
MSKRGEDEYHRRKLTKEKLWMSIISMLRERPLYGYKIATKIRDAKLVTVYYALHRMSREGLVRRIVDKESEKGLRRVFYQATKKGLLLEKKSKLISLKRFEKDR